MWSNTEQFSRKTGSEQRLHTSDGLPVAKQPLSNKPTRKSSFRALAAAWNSDRAVRSSTSKSTAQTPISAKYPSPSTSSPVSSLVSPATPWLSMDNSPLSPLPSTIRKIQAPAMSLSFAPRRAHSRSGSSSGYETAATNARSLSHHTDHSYQTLRSQFEIKRMMSKPAVTSRDQRIRPQTAVENLPSYVVRRAASSDLGSVSRPNQFQQRGQQSIPTGQNSFLSFSPIDSDSANTSAYPWSPFTAESSTATCYPPQLEVKRNRSLLKKPRPISFQSPCTNKESSSSSSEGSPLPGAPPKILTPAASLVEEYKDAERRRAKLAQAAGEAFSQTKAVPSTLSRNAPDMQPVRSISSPQTVTRKAIPLFDEEAPFSDYYLSQDTTPGDSTATSSASHSTPFKRIVDRPLLRINIHANDRYEKQSVTSPNRPTGPSIDLSSRKKTPIFGESLVNESTGKKKHSARNNNGSPSTDGASPQSSRIWKLVKRLSSSVLRERSDFDSKDVVPPVPPVPSGAKYSPRLNQIPSATPKRIDNSLLAVNIAISNQVTKERSSASSGVSIEPTMSQFLVQQPGSNHSSTSSFGQEAFQIPITKEGAHSGDSRVQRATNIVPEPHMFETLFNSRNIGKNTSKDKDNSDSPLIPTFTTRGNTVNRFERFNKTVCKSGSKNSRRPATASGAREGTPNQFAFPRTSSRTVNTPSFRPTAFFNFRKSTDGTRRSEARGKAEIDFDFNRIERHRTRSLDGLFSGNTVLFRALGDPHPSLTEEQKDRRWEELLRRSDLAGGTISVSASPIIS